MTAGRAAALLGLVLTLGACGGPDRATNEAAAQLAYRRGFEAIGTGDWLTAEQYLLQAKQAFPDDPYVLLNLGVVAQRLGRFDEARRYYQQVVDRAPDVVPVQVSDPKASGKTLADLARADLATLPN
ncbi:MAG TPA: tetratricopeptide repeat protein [Aliidongia sp.]|uniref:tetratricopeptide repeat protein n=1 Tax=Aliidongia sp. TaxID=1914230 RepID=UPI002DDD4656|nr:tetratricopeptide repeat protein [Aliidongia sp.]HEV2677295.1 tetratricopeptide repeat protein [Aliidongia sp.]